jgi:hypothetical protein
MYRNPANEAGNFSSSHGSSTGMLFSNASTPNLSSLIIPSLRSHMVIWQSVTTREYRPEHAADPDYNGALFVGSYQDGSGVR